MRPELPRTEAVNADTAGLDCVTTAELVRVLAVEQMKAPAAVLRDADALARAVDEIASRLSTGGRLHYVGAGTSGRLGFLDASEMPPTFGTEPSLVCAHIAGGRSALTQAIEGAEDDGEAGATEMQAHVRSQDAVVGLSASGGAAYVVRAIEVARSIGAWTLGVANNPNSPLGSAAQMQIVLDTGPEPLTGSTRLLAGTSQKVLLNTLSTALMVRLGKTYGNLMVDVVATNKKLRVRALQLVMHLTGEDEGRCRDLVLAAGGSVKLAVLMARRNVNAPDGRAILETSGGSLRQALEAPDERNV
ncbi:MAG: N-acetylmuramic acid 6-phosphate etherase [Candidatus Eremiobacteraeota bacterium]|nr:N-acetylmuramic acid 6-phosphate etherase [Candidatus Eremiobacteraeota bacterium]